MTDNFWYYAKSVNGNYTLYNQEGDVIGSAPNESEAAAKVKEHNDQVSANKAEN